MIKTNPLQKLLLPVALGAAIVASAPLARAKHSETG
jgi:hypothetical protein